MPVPLDLGPVPDGGSGTAFGAVPGLIAIVFVLIVVVTAYRMVRMSRRGVNPLTLQEDLAARALRSDALAPSRSKSDRLAELDGLHRDGRISDAEHAAARARILAE